MEGGWIGSESQAGGGIGPLRRRAPRTRRLTMLSAVDSIPRMASAAPAPEWIPGLISGSAHRDGGAERALVEFELAVDPVRLAAPDADPFVALSDSGRFSRVLLGRLRFGEDCVGNYAVKLQRDHYRPIGAGAGIQGVVAQAVDNREVDAMWQREREIARSIEHPHVQRAVGLQVAGGSGDAGRLGPLFFCRGTRRFLQPVCKSSATPLELCRDDDLLTRHGLEAYSSTLERYLYSPTQVRDAADAPVFYTWSAQSGRQPRDGAVVKRRDDLLALVAEGAGATAGETSSTPASLVPVTVYGSFLLVTPQRPLHFDEYVDALGGADAAALRTAHPSLDATARAPVTGPLLAALDRGPGYVDAVERTTRFAREVLLIKLAAFKRLCEGLQAGYRASGRPHLAVEPANVLADFAVVGDRVPARATSQIFLTDFGAMHRFRPTAARRPDLPALYLPSPDQNAVYRSPQVDAAPFGTELPAQVLPAAKTENAEPSLLTLEVRAVGARIKGVAAGDVVRITPNAPQPGIGEESLWGTIRAVDGQSLHFETRLPNPGATLGQPFDGVLALYRRHIVTADLFGLGMMLLRMVMVHDQRDVFTVRDATRQVLDELARKCPAGTPRARIEAVAIELLGADEEMFTGQSVLFRQADRDRVDAPIRERVWHRVLLLALRLMSEHAGFSFAAHHGDYDPEDPGRILDPLINEVEHLAKELRIDAFGEIARGHDVVTACRQVLAELAEARAAGGEA